MHFSFSKNALFVLPIIIGAGISYKHLYFGVNGGIGMLNMVDEPGVKFHENRVTFSIGYNF